MQRTDLDEVAESAGAGGWMIIWMDGWMDDTTWVPCS